MTRDEKTQEYAQTEDRIAYEIAEREIKRMENALNSILDQIEEYGYY